MSKLIKTVGVVVASVNYSDSDKIITILTPNLGKISVMVKGARKSTNKNSICTEIFTLSNYILFKGRNMYHLNESKLIENYYNLRYDYEILIKASEIIKTANYFSSELEYGNVQMAENFEIFKLTVVALYKLLEISDKKKIEEKDYKKSEIIKNIYFFSFF